MIGRELFTMFKAQSLFQSRFATACFTLACLYEMKASLMSMFSSEEWKTSKFRTSKEGRKVKM